MADRAIADFNTVSRMAPSSFGAWGFSDRAYANALLGRYDDARRDLDMALRIDSSNEDIRRNYRFIAGLMEAPVPRLGSPSSRTELDKIASDKIRLFAEEFCNVPITGSRSIVEASGEVSVALRILWKVLEGIGLQAAGKYQTERWHGPAQADTAKIILKSQDCRMELYRDLKNKVGL